ncbi:aminoglycoside 3'-phosphotransferase [Devosia oryziradicis]|uniref:Aminoglycoside 3'-phosphotransferase n=1 Tax=Devosia oryziradicis TaxID=2801335 RepID=A0ABX7BTA6_9HYPH|nr:APH(3') family aminoglycoside O-phosphotransferase [Devosia oryziradicis]QQR35152.1 aminoglycoside 3'-phosphotransferase [Devosia oryziradicis]
MSTSFTAGPALPARLASLLGEDRQEITLGRSGALVWRFAGKEDSEALFLKADAVDPLSELPGEAERLRWLATTTVAGPRLRASFAESGYNWLLMTALPGTDLTHLVERPEQLRNVLATGLRALHALDPSSCPFDRRLDAKLASGAANLFAGRVDETDFDESRLGWTGHQVLDWLHAHRPAGEDLVVAHGDASLPNVMAQDDAFAGVVDCGRLGVADRWQDLAIACRSLIYNCGREHVAPFLDAYGAEWDEERYRYYCTLDELF